MWLPDKNKRSWRKVKVGECGTAKYILYIIRGWLNTRLWTALAASQQCTSQSISKQMYTFLLRFGFLILNELIWLWNAISNSYMQSRATCFGNNKSHCTRKLKTSQALRQDLKKSYFDSMHLISCWSDEKRSHYAKLASNHLDRYTP